MQMKTCSATPPASVEAGDIPQTTFCAFDVARAATAPSGIYPEMLTWTRDASLDAAPSHSH